MVDWDQIKVEFGTMSVRKLGEKHGVSHVAILKRAKSERWLPFPPGKLSVESPVLRPGGVEPISVDTRSRWSVMHNQFVPLKISPPFCCGFCGYMSDDFSKEEHLCEGKKAFQKAPLARRSQREVNEQRAGDLEARVRAGGQPPKGPTVDERIAAINGST